MPRHKISQRQFLVKEAKENIGPYILSVLQAEWKAYFSLLKKLSGLKKKRVHAARTAIRRLLMLLDLIECILPAETLKKIRSSLDHRQKALGRLRDIHIQLDYVNARRRA